MAFIRRRQEIQPIASINLTSLLDVTFVLLLTFMIVAPTLKTGIKLDLPQVENAAQLPSRKTATVTLRPADAPGEAAWIYLDNKRQTQEDLKKGLEELLARHGEKLDVVIEPDRKVPCEDMLQVFALVQGIGIESVGVVTVPEKKK